MKTSMFLKLNFKSAGNPTWRQANPAQATTDAGTDRHDLVCALGEIGDHEATVA